MNKQIVLSLITASLLGVSVPAIADNDRGHAGGWYIDDEHGKNHKHAQHRRSDHKAEGRGHKHKKYKHKQKKIVIIKKPAHHRHDRRHGHHSGPKFAEVLRVKPIRSVTKKIKYLPPGRCRHGNHSGNLFDSVHTLDVVLGGLRIQADRHHDCKRIVKEVDTDYRVTYRYKGSKYVVHMNTHPGNYVRVNRFGELIHG